MCIRDSHRVPQLISQPKRNGWITTEGTKLNVKAVINGHSNEMDTNLQLSVLKVGVLNTTRLALCNKNICLYFKWPPSDIRKTVIHACRSRSKRGDCQVFIAWRVIIFPLRGVWSVSYTHLDVYKRQISFHPSATQNRRACPTFCPRFVICRIWYSKLRLKAFSSM